MSKSLFIFGTSDYASLVAHYFQQQNQPSLTGFVVDDEFVHDAEYLGFPVTAYSEFTQTAVNQQTTIFSAVGYKSMGERKAIFDRLYKANFSMISFVHPTAYVDPSASIGLNCIIMPGVVIEPNVSIGDNVTIWSNATVCHDTEIGSHCFLASNCVVGGRCVLGSTSFFGFSSTVMQNTTVEPETLLGASSLLQACEAPCGKFIGVPARRVSDHKTTGVCVS